MIRNKLPSDSVMVKHSFLSRTGLYPVNYGMRGAFAEKSNGKTLVGANVDFF